MTTVLLTTQTAAMAAAIMQKERAPVGPPGVKVKAWVYADIGRSRSICAGAIAPIIFV
jgi:hypothetical protein